MKIYSNKTTLKNYRRQGFCSARKRVFLGNCCSFGGNIRMKRKEVDPQKELAVFMFWVLIVFMVVEFALYRWDTYESAHFSNVTSVKFKD